MANISKSMIRITIALAIILVIFSAVFLGMKVYEKFNVDYTISEAVR